MGKLVETFAFGGSRLADGTPNASGKVWIYIQNTTTLAPVFADVFSDSLITQPIVLDAAGRAIFYVDQVVTIHVETAAGATVNDYNLADSPGVVQVENPFYTGTLPDGSQGPGGVTDLQKILTSAGVSLGGPDFTYIATPGAPSRSVGAWMREVHLSVKDFGAVGDGHTDDTQAIQNTINQCAALGGGIVYLPPGTYNITAVIIVPGGNISIVGSGSSSAISNQSPVSGCFSFPNGGGGQLAQFSIFSGAGSSGIAVSMSRPQGAALLDLNISGHLIDIDINGTGASPTLYYQIARCILFTTGGAGARAIRSNGGLYSVSITASILKGNTTEADLEFIGNTAGASFVGSTNVSSCYIHYGALLTSVSTGASGVVAFHGNAFGNDGTAHKRILTTGTTPRISNVGNGVEGLAYSVTTTSTIVPDLGNGRVVRVSAAGAGAITTSFDPPTPLAMPVRGTQFHFSLINVGPGLSTWAFNAAAGGYHLKPATPINTAVGARTELIVEYDPDSNYWAEICRTEIVA